MPGRDGNCLALSGLGFIVRAPQGCAPSSLALGWIVPPRWGWAQMKSVLLPSGHSEDALGSARGLRAEGGGPPRTPDFSDPPLPSDPLSGNSLSGGPALPGFGIRV